MKHEERRVVKSKSGGRMSASYLSYGGRSIRIPGAIQRGADDRCRTMRSRGRSSCLASNPPAPAASGYRYNFRPPRLPSFEDRSALARPRAASKFHCSRESGRVGEAGRAEKRTDGQSTGIVSVKLHAYIPANLISEEYLVRGTLFATILYTHTYPHTHIYTG